MAKPGAPEVAVDDSMAEPGAPEVAVDDSDENFAAGLFALAVCGETRPADPAPSARDEDVSTEILTSRTIDKLRDEAFPNNVFPRVPDARFSFIKKLIVKNDTYKRLNYLFSRLFIKAPSISSSNIAALFEISEAEALGVCTRGGKGKLPTHDDCLPLRQTPYNGAVGNIYEAFRHPTTAVVTDDGFGLLRINKDVYSRMVQGEAPDGVTKLFRALSPYSRLVMLQKYPSLQPAVLRYTVTAQIEMSDDDKQMTAQAYAVFDTLMDGMACLDAKDKRILLELAFYFVGRHVNSASYGVAVAENMNFSCVLFQIIVVLSDYMPLWNKNDTIDVGLLPDGLESPDSDVSKTGKRLVADYIGNGVKIVGTAKGPAMPPWYNCFSGKKVSTRKRETKTEEDAAADAKAAKKEAEEDAAADAKAAAKEAEDRKKAAAGAARKAAAAKAKMGVEGERGGEQGGTGWAAGGGEWEGEDENRWRKGPMRRRTVGRYKKEPRNKGKKKKTGRRKGGADSPSSSSSSSRGSSHDSVSSDTQDEDDTMRVSELKFANHVLRKEIREVLSNIKNAEFTIGRRQVTDALSWKVVAPTVTGVAPAVTGVPGFEQAVGAAVNTIKKFGYEINDMSGIVPSVSTTAHSKLAAVLEKTKTALQTVLADACADYDKILVPYNARRCTGPTRWDNRSDRYFYCSFDHFKWDVIRDDVYGLHHRQPITLILCDKHKYEFQKLSQFTVTTISSTLKTGLHAYILTLGLQ